MSSTGAEPPSGLSLRRMYTQERTSSKGCLKTKKNRPVSENAVMDEVTSCMRFSNPDKAGAAYLHGGIFLLPLVHGHNDLLVHPAHLHHMYRDCQASTGITKGFPELTRPPSQRLRATSGFMNDHDEHAN